MNCFLGLKRPLRCFAFSFLWVFADFLNYMPNKIKLFLKMVKSCIFALYGMELEKLVKISKNEKMQHQLDVLSPKSNSKIIFRIFVNILPTLNKTWPKKITCFLWFFQKLCVACEISILKMFTFMYFNAFFKKLCYKIKMPKRDV